MCLCSHRSIFSPVRPDLSTFNSPGLKSRCSILGCGLSVLPTHSAFTIITPNLSKSRESGHQGVCETSWLWGATLPPSYLIHHQFSLECNVCQTVCSFCDSMSAVQHHLLACTVPGTLSCLICQHLQTLLVPSVLLSASKYCWNA